MQWKLVELGQLSSFGAQARLQARQSVDTAYHLPLALVLESFDGILKQPRLEEAPLTIELVILASADRACACIPSGGTQTVVLDLGFLELVADFLMVAGGLGDAFPVLAPRFAHLAAPEPIWPSDEDRQTFKAAIEADHFGFERYDPGDWGDLAADEEEAEQTITGSQIFRDVARKLSLALPHLRKRADVFDAFMAWPVHHHGVSYPSSCVLFNHIVTGGDGGFDEMQSLRTRHFEQQIVTGSVMILLHEVAHVLHPDAEVGRWRQGHEAAEIIGFLDIMARYQPPDGEYARLINRILAAFRSGEGEGVDRRAQRALYECHYDIRAVDMFIDAHLEAGDADWAGSALAMIFQSFSSTIALLVFKEHLLLAMQSPDRLHGAGDEARDETIKRLTTLFAFMRTRLARSWPDAKPDQIDAQFQNAIDNVTMLHRYFSIDMLNGLPIFEEEGESYRQAAARAWVQFMAIVSADQG